LRYGGHNTRSIIQGGHVYGVMAKKRGAYLEEAMLEVWCPQNEEFNSKRP
jgi:hypothetical protein